VIVRRPFEAVVQEHGVVVLRVCRAMLGPDEADDAWSETFLSAMRAWPELDEHADVRAWLVTIAHHRSVDQLRRRSRRPLSVGGPEHVERAGGERALARRSGRTALGAAAALDGSADGGLLELVRALPPKQRSAVVCRYLADMSYDDVAAVAGTSVVAARRNAADGIASLRRTYTPEEER
jgi:RNA polymerase sigma factor (sigma-70 family)